MIAPPLFSSGVGHSGGSTSTPSEALGILNHSEGSGAGTVGQEADSAAEENSAPRRVLGKRPGEDLASGDRSEKRGVQMCCWKLLVVFNDHFVTFCSLKKNVFLLAGDGAGGPIYGKEMGLRPRAKRNRGPTEVKKRGVGQLK